MVRAGVFFLAAIAAVATTAAACSDETAQGSSSSSSGNPDSDAGRVDGGGGGDEASATPPPPVPGIHAEYFDGYHDKVVSRIEPNIDHDWKADAPAPGVSKDRFSARFTGILTPTRTGKTTLAIDADDGVRIWINDKLVLDDWHAHFVQRTTTDVDLSANVPVSIRVDYFEVDLDASIKLSWSSAAGDGGGFAEEVIKADRFTTTNVASTQPAPKPPFTNPVIAFDCPDPGVIGTGGSQGDDGKYYAVCTGGTFPIRTSRDLVTWGDVQGAAAILPAAGKPAWAANGGRNWAPEIHKAGNQFLAYYTSVNGADVLSIGVAHSASPTGPFTDRGSALVEDPKGVIDATFFEDDDGSRYLFYKIDGNALGQPTPIFVRKLAADGLSFAAGSTPQQTITNDGATWEGGVVEAPWVVKRDGRYYMFYSGNVYDHRYRTGVARSTSIMGTWEKKGGPPILSNNDAWVGPGHGSVVPIASLDYFVYHAWQNNGAGLAVTAKGRMILVDKIVWTGGWPSISDGTPTKGAQPWPGEPL